MSFLISSGLNLTAKGALTLSKNATFCRDLLDILIEIVDAAMDEDTELTHTGTLSDSIIKILKDKNFEVVKIHSHKYNISWDIS